MNTVDLDENVNVSRDGAGITSGAHCRPFRYAIFACGAIAAAQAMAQATRDEAHRACDHLVGYDDCFGACVEWHMSSSPWSDDDLIRRGEECMDENLGWDDYEDTEEVVVVGHPPPQPEPPVIPAPDVTVVPNPTLPPSLDDVAITGEKPRVAAINDCIDRLTRYDETDRDDQLIEQLQDAEIEFKYGDLGGTVTGRTTPEYAPIRVAGTNNCRTRTSRYRIQLDTSQITNGSIGLSKERLAMTMVHEYVHVAYFEGGDHPCDLIDDHEHGDLIYQMAWDVYLDIFGIRAPEDPKYESVERWNSQRPACLRE